MIVICLPNKNRLQIRESCLSGFGQTHKVMFTLYTDLCLDVFKIFSKSVSSAMDLDTQKALLLLSRFKKHKNYAAGSAVSDYHIWHTMCRELHFEVEKEKGTCRAPNCKE